MYQNPNSSFEDKEPKEEIFNSIKARANSKRNRTERLAHWMTSNFGSMNFLAINVIFFTTWILINDDHIRGIPSFDPFPYNMMATIISFEAIVLSIFVLISQNRDIKVDDLREEIHLQVNLISEQEITKIMKMIAMLLEKHGVDLSTDPELRKLIRPINQEEIEKKIEKEIFP